MRTCIVVEPEIEGNLGFLARVMANFDIEQLSLVNPQFSIGEEARKRAVHAQDIIDGCRIYESLESAIEDVDFAVATTGLDTSSSNILRNAVTPATMAEQAADIEGTIGVVLGRESKGLSNEEIRCCDLVVTVPTSEDYPVMNITHAAAVVFYELFVKQADTVREASTRGEKQQLMDTFKKLLTQIGYPEDEKERTMLCLKNFIGRSFVDKKEAGTLIGTFKRIQQSLGDS